jgi:hypothetical protein
MTESVRMVSARDALNLACRSDLRLRGTTLGVTASISRGWTRVGPASAKERSILSSVVRYGAAIAGVTPQILPNGGIIAG